MLVPLLIAAALHVDPDAGNNKFDATFDAPLGERINATSSAVACDVTYDEKAGAASGACSVPLTSITVDSEPTKTEHFQQWTTNKKVDPKECRIEAKFEGVKVEPALTGTPSNGVPKTSNSDAVPQPSKISGEAAFTVCGRARTDGKKERLTGTAMMLPDGRIRVRARVEKFNRDRYHIGPKYTDGWLSRVQQLAPVVAETGTLEISLFAKPAETKATAKP
jgi:hypothetical protein